jgi:ketosteroid isomerase-like protein
VDRAKPETERGFWPFAGDGEIEMNIRSTLTELCAAFNAHDLDRIMAFFSDDCILEMPRGDKPWGSRFEGKRAVREALASRFQGPARRPLRR